MNERIKELAKDAKYAVEHEGIILELVLEKFAELIVRDCDRYVTERYDKDGFTEPWISPGDLLNHFGVDS